MLRLTNTHRYRVSNRMAALAAVLLVVATVASVGGALDRTQTAAPTLVGTNDGVATNTTVRSAKANKGFRVSLYLFRRN